MDPVSCCCSHRLKRGCHSGKGWSPAIPGMWLMQVSHTCTGFSPRCWVWCGDPGLGTHGFPFMIELCDSGKPLPTSIHCTPARMVGNTCPFATFILCFPRQQPKSRVFLPKCCFLRYSVEGADWWVHRTSSSTAPFTKKKLYFVIFHFGRPPKILFEQRIP